MIARLFLSLSAVLMLASCGNFTLRNNNGLVILHPVEGYAEDNENREVMDRLLSLRLEPTPSGVIVHATGLPPRQGYWEAELVAENRGRPEDGVLTYTFRAWPSRAGTRTGTPYSREVHVAQFISNAKLARVRQINVVAAQNSMTGRR